MGEWADRLAARVMVRIENEADAIGVGAVAGIRERINIPVEYVEYENSSGETAIRVERSLPGQPPRREFGHLWESEHHDVTPSPNVVLLEIINNCEYAGVLDQGMGRLKARPFHYLPETLGATEIKQRIHDAIIGKR